MITSCSDQELLHQVFDHYHQCLLEDDSVREFLQRRRIYSKKLIADHKLGISNRSLGKQLPDGQLKAGKEIREQLIRLGVYKANRKEKFNGSLVVPIYDSQGNIVNAYARKTGRSLRMGTEHHLSLNDTHHLWNPQALGSDVLIICKSMMDALTFYAHGHENVTCVSGVDSLPQYLEQIASAKASRLIISPELSIYEPQLLETGQELYRFKLPPEMDVNKLVMSVPNGEAALDNLLRHVEWLGGANPVIEEPTQSQPHCDDLDDLDELFADEIVTENSPLKGASDAVSSPYIDVQLRDDECIKTDNKEAENASNAKGEKTSKVVKNHEIALRYGDRKYRVRGLDKNLTYERLKVNILVSRGNEFHVDTFDLYSSKHRQCYINLAKVELGISEDIIKQDLGRVLMELEQLQDELIQKNFQLEPDKPELTPQQRHDALELLRSPHLIEQVQRDFENLGVVGESTNTLVGYLAATSRLMNDPLAIVIQSTSAAGKSTLMEAILALMPEEERIALSSMTGQSLYYMGNLGLKHKILSVAEDEGIKDASYALKVLQSEGSISIASTSKNQSGNFQTDQYSVEGPVQLFLTTTSINMDEELMNRCLVLTVNESRDHTATIHELQRRAETISGLVLQQKRRELIQLHQNAQRLLESVLVVNPYAEKLTFRSDKTRTRRDHKKYLALIRCIALLHQFQRPRKHHEHGGELIEYIEVQPSDIELANNLAHEILGTSLDELPPQTRNLLNLIHAYVKEQCRKLEIDQKAFRFGRKEVRDATNWGNTQLKIHFQRLEELEYVVVHGGGRGKTKEYELLYHGEGEEQKSFMLGLVEPESLVTTAEMGNWSGLNQ